MKRLIVLSAILLGLSDPASVQGAVRHDENLHDENLARFMPFTLDAGQKEIGVQARIYRKAADQGDVEAQYNLGVMLEHGQGILRSSTEAAEWYRRAAEQGFAPAQYNLGVLYLQGAGVPRQDHAATKWFRKAADQGLAEAQYNLGVMYKDGRGVRQDVVQAYQWIALAAAQGIAPAIEWRDFLDKVMPADQLAQARRMARKWQPVQDVTHQ